MHPDGKLVFPEIRRIELHDFTLYRLQPHIVVDLPPGVFCLAGANGLGKSTFLAALNYALTSIVSDPDRGFKSVDEYPQLNTGFSEKYFSGRIGESDRETASITVDMQVGTHHYRLCRGVFEPNELRELLITDIATGQQVLDAMKHLPIERERIYENHIVEDVGVRSFAQFVYLQHLVFTFDERRHLLLWDKRALTPAIYLAIGADFQKAEAAEQLRRDMEKADSRGRNLNYQAGNVRNRMETLAAALQGNASSGASDVDWTDIEEEMEALDQEVAQRKKDVDYKRDLADDAKLKLMELGARLLSLRSAYSKEFSARIEGRSRVEWHPLITASISEAKCALCGNTASQAISSIELKISKHICPLCDMPVEEESSVPTDSIERLSQLDLEIANVQRELDEVAAARERLEAELQAALDRLDAANAARKRFEDLNDKALLEFRAHKEMQDASTGIAANLEKLRLERDEIRRLSRAAYDERDAIKKELMKLQNELQQKYSAAETTFVPLFKDLAKTFLGVDLDIQMDSSRSAAESGFSFRLEMEGNARRETYQLSESQRFFLDIALRMALARYMAAQGSRATLFIDTPEGSLDIAYESRAGQMFARFVETQHNIVMTANINSSQILMRLARECGHQGMTLHRMTSWNILSDVQLQEEGLFDKAYNAIEAELH